MQPMPAIKPPRQVKYFLLPLKCPGCAMTSRTPVTAVETLQLPCWATAEGKPRSPSDGAAGWSRGPLQGTAALRPSLLSTATPCSQGDAGHPDPRGLQPAKSSQDYLFPHLLSSAEAAVKNVANSATPCRGTAPDICLCLHTDMGLPGEEKLPKALRRLASDALQLHKTVT